MKAIKQTLLALALASAFTSANATPVDWTLDIAQTGFIAVKTYGTFTYDANTNTYSNVALKFNIDTGSFGANSGSDASRLIYGDGSTGIYTLTFDTLLSNDGGKVTGIGSNYVNGESALWLFTVTGVPQATASAVPEPEVYAMMLAGLGLVGFAARRKLS